MALYTYQSAFFSPYIHDQIVRLFIHFHENPGLRQARNNHGDIGRQCRPKFFDPRKNFET